MVKRGDLEQLGEAAQKKAIKMKVEGLPNSTIASKLNEEFSADLSEQQVGLFIKRSKNKTFSYMKEDRNFEMKMAKYHFDTISQIKNLNKEMWEFFYEIKKTPELKDKIITCPKCGKRLTLQMQSYGLLIKAADHLLKQIEHQDKVLGRMKDKGMTINYNFVDMSKKIQNVMPRLMHEADRLGIIKIKNKKRLKEVFV